jgi:DNA-binding SARP family transcriptional activator
MLQIKLFGATSVTGPDGTVIPGDMVGVKPRQILEILALSAGRPVPKEHLADLIWEGAPPRSYLGTLESYVCVLRRSLGLSRGRESAIATARRGYVLDADTVEVDLLDFRRLVRSAEAHAADPAAASELLQRALALADGELLADETYAAWAVAEREVVRREVVTAASLAAGHALALGAPDLAERSARRALELDVLAEQAWCLLMRALWAAGRPTEALRRFFELRDHLATELGTGPSAASQALYMEILRDVDVDRRDGARDTREEVRLLMLLLRQAMGSFPSAEEHGIDGALALAADLVA